MMQSDDDLAQWISTALQEAKKHSSVWRMHAREWYDFYAGNQWEEEAKAQMIEQRKVPVVFNRVARTVNAVIGLEIQNRQQVQYIPREPGDTQVNELYTSAADWIRDNCDAEDEESESFQDLMISGIGGTETRMDYDENPDGQPVIERVDPLELYWDPVARKKNLRDRRWCARIKRVSDEDIREMWPDYVPPEKSSETYLDEQDSPHDSTRPLYNDDQPSATQPKHRELVCFQWWEREQYFRFQDIDGQIKSISEEQARSLQERMTALGMPMPEMVKQTKKIYNKAYMVGGTVLESMPLEVQSGFTLHLITGARDRNNNTWFGLVALMMDPQRWANKWLSQIMHILNSSAKGGLIAERDAFAKTADAEASWAKAETITWANPGAVSGGKIQPKPTTAMPDGFAKLLDFAVNSINDVPGVNMELMGLVGTNQPGVLENMRKQAGMTILAVFFDAIRLYRKDQGRIMIEIIRDKISDGRLIRVLGKDGAQYIPLLRDESAKEFDVVVDEAPTSPNNKERVFAMMTQLAPVLQNSGIPLTPDLLEYSPLPAALVQKWQQFIRENKQVPSELQAQMMQMQQVIQATQQDAQKLAQENFRLKTDATVEVYRINEQAKIDRELASVKAETESEKRAVEVYRVNMDAMLERLGMSIQSATSDMKMAVETRLKQSQMQETAQNNMAEDVANSTQIAMQIIGDFGDKMHELISGISNQMQIQGSQMVDAVNAMTEYQRTPKRVVRGPDGSMTVQTVQ